MTTHCKHLKYVPAICSDCSDKLFNFVEAQARIHMSELSFREAIFRGYFPNEAKLARDLIKEIGESE